MSQQNSCPQGPHDVSERDRRIYQQVRVEGRSQREVAAEHQLSQTRVSKIVRRVFRWLSQLVLSREYPAPSGVAETPRLAPLQTAARVYREKLRHYVALALAAFDQSKRQEVVITSFVVERDGNQLLHLPRKVLVIRRSTQGDIRYLQAAQKFAQILAEFEGRASDSDVALQPKPPPRFGHDQAGREKWHSHRELPSETSFDVCHNGARSDV